MYITIINYSIPKVFCNIKLNKKELKLFNEERIVFDEYGNNIFKDSTCHYVMMKNKIEIEL